MSDLHQPAVTAADADPLTAEDMYRLCNLYDSIMELTMRHIFTHGRDDAMVHMIREICSETKEDA